MIDTTNGLPVAETLYNIQSYRHCYGAHPFPGILLPQLITAATTKNGHEAERTALARQLAADNLVLEWVDTQDGWVWPVRERQRHLPIGKLKEKGEVIGQKLYEAWVREPNPEIQILLFKTSCNFARAFFRPDLFPQKWQKPRSLVTSREIIPDFFLLSNWLTQAKVLGHYLCLQTDIQVSADLDCRQRFLNQLMAEVYLLIEHTLSKLTEYDRVQFLKHAVMMPFSIPNLEKFDIQFLGQLWTSNLWDNFRRQYRIQLEVIKTDHQFKHHYPEEMQEFKRICEFPARVGLQTATDRLKAYQPSSAKLLSPR